MRAVVQRVVSGGVDVASGKKEMIGKGLVVLLGIEHEDTKADIDWLVRKIVNMRIFSDEDDKMNLSLLDIEGECLIVSQFTLHASTKKGNRPSFIQAARPEQAIPLYEQFIQSVQAKGIKVSSGEFGGDMLVDIQNDGPVTIIIDSKEKW